MEGYVQELGQTKVKRFCQTLDLKNDCGLINEYKFWHKSENIWPEIPQGIKAIGILDMEIYLIDNRLFMIVETKLDFDWNTAFGKLATMDKQAEWEAFVSKFQVSAENASSSDKWRLMERIFKL